MNAVLRGLVPRLCADSRPCKFGQGILVTGNSLNAELPEMVRSGEFELLTKPFHPEDLIEKLGKQTIAHRRREMAAA